MIPTLRAQTVCGLVKIGGTLEMMIVVTLGLYFVQPHASVVGYYVLQMIGAVLIGLALYSAYDEVEMRPWAMLIFVPVLFIGYVPMVVVLQPMIGGVQVSFVGNALLLEFGALVLAQALGYLPSLRRAPQTG